MGSQWNEACVSLLEPASLTLKQQSVWVAGRSDAVLVLKTAGKRQVQTLGGLSVRRS